jgi:hypothetical protein
MKSCFVIFVHLIICVLSNDLATANEDQCPTAISFPARVSAPDGWRVWRYTDRQNLVLKDITFTDGDPRNGVSLNPLTSVNSENYRRDHYDFRSNTYGYIWIICQYSNINIELTRITSNKWKRCDINYNRRFEDWYLKSVSCH